MTESEANQASGASLGTRRRSDGVGEHRPVQVDDANAAEPQEGVDLTLEAEGARGLGQKAGVDPDGVAFDDPMYHQPVSFDRSSQSQLTKAPPGKQDPALQDAMRQQPASHDATSHDSTPRAPAAYDLASQEPVSEDAESYDPLSLGQLLGLAPNPLDRVGEVVDGRYELIEVLGKGGMGVVYRARQVNVAREVAVKVIHPMRSSGADEEAQRRALERFDREMATTAQLEHPNIVRLYDVGQTGGDVYMAMELLGGRTLAQLLRDEGPLSVERATHIGVQLASALQAAHERGIVHRDLKPANIIVRDTAGHKDMVTVLDFGLAQLASVQGKGNARLTQAGAMLGTPMYAAPEQGRGAVVDHRADLYAVGVVLYEVVTGAPPFDGTVLELLHQHSLAVVRRPSEVAPEIGVARWFEQLLLELLEKDPEARPQSATDLMARLKAGDDVKRPGPRAPGRRKAAAWGLAILVVGAVGAVGAAVTWRLVQQGAHEPNVNVAPRSAAVATGEAKVVGQVPDAESATARVVDAGSEAKPAVVKPAPIPEAQAEPEREDRPELKVPSTKGFNRAATLVGTPKVVGNTCAAVLNVPYGGTAYLVWTRPDGKTNRWSHKVAPAAKGAHLQWRFPGPSTGTRRCDVYFGGKNLGTGTSPQE